MFTLTKSQETSLKKVANTKGKYIGNVMENNFFNDQKINNGANDMIAKTEYNCLTTGNKLKIYELLSKRPVDPFNLKISDINTSNIDKFVSYANANGI